MGPLEAQGSKLAQDILERERMRAEIAGKSAPGMGAEPIDPMLASLIGGAADAASTYAFLKRGTGREDNPMLSWTKGKPALTGMAAMGGTLGMNAAAGLIGKKYPKLRDALRANLGAEQMILASSNARMAGRGKRGSFKVYGDTMEQSRTRQSGKLHGKP